MCDFQFTNAAWSLPGRLTPLRGPSSLADPFSSSVAVCFTVKSAKPVGL
jgi:hypothetical protein